MRGWRAGGEEVRRRSGVKKNKNKGCVGFFFLGGGGCVLFCFFFLK